MFNYTKAFGKYGASMGRPNDNPANFEAVKVRLERVMLDSGGYDKGGAYWGHSKLLFVAYTLAGEDTDDVQYFLRASSRDDAKRQILEMADCSFYR